ncbi:hypothetical protein G6L81_07410 [Agrobacterium rhizogenes]|nr:hypothetical protein [Rhizobium rhizogenes]
MMSLTSPGDKGQRYEIYAIGWPLEEKTIIGWAESAAGADRMAAAARLAPGCKRTEIRDRWGRQAIQACDVEPYEPAIALDELPARLLTGPHGSFHLNYNDGHAVQYLTAAEYFLGFPEQDFGWISAEEREKAISSNSVWTLQWYPKNPISHYVVRGSTAAAVLAAALKEDGV